MAASGEGLNYAVAVDGSDLSHKAFDAVACLFSQKPEKDDRFFVIHVKDSSKDYLPAHLTPKHIIEDAKTGCIKRRITEDKVITVLEEKEGSTLSTLLSVARKEHIDFLGIGSYGRKGPKSSTSTFGTVSDGALRDCPASIVIAKPSSTIPDQSVHFMVCVDNSPNSWRAADMAIAMAKRTVSPDITLLYVDRFESFKQKVMEKADKKLADNDIHGQGVFLKKGPKSIGETIVDYAIEHDVHFVVLGSTGHKHQAGNAHTVGTVSGYCAHHAPMCTVLVKPKM
uniref:UspA domain-containing protein n=1 Tax=Palpitomonas bilix TaxID=652834 RepID=A0A7S3GGC0_9EUKA|mmetsp:Transcript_48115/g.125143  ORF Transcript_48115/g.125143 Transcript_48115/m.125143 type:complete len:283 (+) Transcript_48115:141-989(+)|eukprot:CAMPEP_0113882894 /NCGR_PEP_ID=MMETSP0780_2-20120614/9249_1 /TAXON_ID=652834 /ORGANISM="Palpitomonas bilix" /LENGTH=282 /DNA_ID=CAMNT_0000870041 /DNA_START=101 /DNA_END=949 /DNA_ORIENTATION=- /assembly_acc=CAM_ASM_000599